MKFKAILILALFAVLFWSCNDDFLERFPESELSGDTFFGTEESLKTYNNSIYHLAGNADQYKFLLGFNDDAWQSTNRGIFFEDVKSDNLAQNHGSNRYLEEIAAGLYELNDERSNALWGWHWQQLYNINYLLENYDKATATDQDTRDIYAGEARLFRAAFYFDKVKRYGAVPWIDKSLNIDSPELFGERTPRETVMANVLEDINFAIDHLPDEWSQSVDKRRMTRSIALALKSRICLHEGTFRKYHNIGSDANTWLEAAADAAEILINEGRDQLHSTGGPDEAYATLFKQVDLTGNKEVLLFRKYVRGVNSHAFHNAHIGKYFGLTKDFVDDYLCSDGEPIALSALYLGDDTREDELKNRDPRLRQTIVFPDNVPNVGDKDSEKYLGGLGRLHPGLLGEPGNRYRTSTGYAPHKLFDFEDWRTGYSNQENDAIIIRYGEVLLNYAEAKAELGTISQGDLDISINKLRDRVGMTHLTTTPALDPKYASEGLSPIIIEGRRERRVELALEGFRYDDLMRWAKGAYLTKPKLGMRFEDAVAAQFPDAEVNVTTVGGKKYIDPYKGTVYETRIFDEGKHYYFPIPAEQITLNPALTQNPNW